MNYKVNKVKVRKEIKQLETCINALSTYLKAIKKLDFSYNDDYDIHRLENYKQEYKDLNSQLTCKHIGTTVICHENHHNGTNNYEIICNNCNFTLKYY